MWRLALNISTISRRELIQLFRNRVQRRDLVSVVMSLRALLLFEICGFQDSENLDWGLLGRNTIQYGSRLKSW
jgi:hypothetical protein